MEGSDVIIPNGELLSKLVTNWTLSERRRLLKISVGVVYGSSVDQVEQLLLRMAAGHSLVLDAPAPTVLFLNLGDSAQEGIQVPYPTRTLLFERSPSSEPGSSVPASLRPPSEPAP